MRTETPSGLRTITHAHIEAIEAAQAFDQAQRITKWEAGELAKVACIAARVGDFPLNLLRDLIDRTQPSDWTDDDSVPVAWPSNFTLAMMHQSNVTTVQRAIHKITKAGLIIPRDRGGRHRCGTRADDGFDGFVEDTCRAYYARTMGAPSVPPGRYFRMHMVGYFEGIDS